jgi:hypothetical protein
MAARNGETDRRLSRSRRSVAWGRIVAISHVTTVWTNPVERHLQGCVDDRVNRWRAHLLYWTWFVVTVLFGIAAAADIVGYGPQAYLGGLLTGAAYVFALKSPPKQGKISDGDEAQRSPAADRDHLPYPSVPREILEISDDQERSSMPKKRKPRRPLRSQEPKALSVIERLRGFSRRLGE